MKLNAAAVLVLSLSVLLFSGASFALDGIDLKGPVEVAAEGACSQLVQIKYPFLACGADGEIGLSDEHATWENSRQIPIGTDWTEGDGYWGPDLNVLEPRSEM